MTVSRDSGDEATEWEVRRDVKGGMVTVHVGRR